MKAVRRNAAQERQQLAAKEAYFRSASPAERRKYGLAPHPERPAPVMVSAAVSWRLPGPLVASAGRPFYGSDNSRDRAYREAWDTARRIAHLESGNLAGERLTDTQEGMARTYAELIVAGAVDQARQVLDTLRGNARRVWDGRIQDAQDAIGRRMRGDAFVLTAAAVRDGHARARYRVARATGRGGVA